MAQPNQLVRQHNALINASYALEPLELRLFLAGLSRVNQADDVFAEYRVPFHEIIGDQDGGNSYKQLKAACTNITKRDVYIEVLNDDGSRNPEADFDSYPLMAKASYRRTQGVILFEFNHHMRGYLLNLRENGHFTMAHLAQVLKLKSVYAFRLYWLLKEYASFGKRRLTYDDLRFVLRLQGKYEGRFNGFRERVLEPCKKELADTDMAFSYEPIRTGKSVVAVDFTFQRKATDTKNTAVVRDSWAESLRKMTINEATINEINKAITDGLHDPGYVDFCVQKIVGILKDKPGHIKEPRGYLHDMLKNKTWLPDYARWKNGEKKRAQAAKSKPEHVLTLADIDKMYAEGGDKRRGKWSEFYHHRDIFINSYIEADQFYKAEQRDGQTVWVRLVASAQPKLDI